MRNRPYLLRETVFVSEVAIVAPASEQMGCCPGRTGGSLPVVEVVEQKHPYPSAGAEAGNPVVGTVAVAQTAEALAAPKFADCPQSSRKDRSKAWTEAAVVAP